MRSPTGCYRSKVVTLECGREVVVREMNLGGLVKACWEMYADEESFAASPSSLHAAVLARGSLFSDLAVRHTSLSRDFVGQLGRRHDWEKLIDAVMPAGSIDGLFGHDPGERTFLDCFGELMHLFAAAYGWSLREVMGLPLSVASHLAHRIRRQRVRELKHALVRSGWARLDSPLREHLWRELDRLGQTSTGPAEAEPGHLREAKG